LALKYVKKVLISVINDRIEVMAAILYNILVSRELMSRLIEKFHKASRVDAPMGFRTARTAAAVPKILLIADLEAGTLEKRADYLEAADAVLLHFAGTAWTVKAVQKIVASLPDIPWGLDMADDEAKKVAGMGAGVDFVIFAIDSQVADSPRDDKTGKVLQVESSLDDGLLRAINDLPVHAVLATDVFGGEDSSLIWHRLMILQHLANLLAKPLIVSTRTDISEKELKALWDAGVDGVIVAFDKAGTGIKEMRQAIDKLPPRSGRKRGKAGVVLPRSAGETREPAPPDEEEEEDE
jgi:hypothetical protein